MHRGGHTAAVTVHGDARRGRSGDRGRAPRNACAGSQTPKDRACSSALTRQTLSVHIAILLQLQHLKHAHELLLLKLLLVTAHRLLMRHILNAACGLVLEGIRCLIGWQARAAIEHALECTEGLEVARLLMAVDEVSHHSMPDVGWLDRRRHVG